MEGIIEWMRERLFDTELCRNDFEKYDVPAIRECMEPFFWMVREYGTSLEFIGPTRMHKFFDTESGRFNLYRDNKAPIASMVYWNDNGKYFFYDGLQVIRVQKREIEEIYLNIWGAEIDRLSTVHNEEFAMCDAGISIKMDDSTKEKYKAACELAKASNDTSLEDCINRLKGHARYAVNHYIRIYPDFADHSFTFTEYINDHPTLSGGIIYHGNPDEGYKENCSVQLTPSYGWQIHT